MRVYSETSSIYLRLNSDEDEDDLLLDEKGAEAPPLLVIASKEFTNVIAV